MDMVIAKNSTLWRKFSRKWMEIKVAEFKGECECYDADENPYQGNVYFFEVEDKIAKVIFSKNASYCNLVYYIVKKMNESLLCDSNGVFLLDDLPEFNATSLGRVIQWWKTLWHPLTIKRLMRSKQRN